MKFITICTLEAAKTDYDTVHINIDHIVTITEYWLQIEGQDCMKAHAKILLSNGTEIICDEEVDTIEKEYKELFKQYC
ncbi:MAG: hypothetical protein ACK55K_06260 [Bacteroidota bacterium]